MAVGEESEKRRGKMRPVGRELPRIAGRVLGKRGLGEAQLLAEWSAVVGDELAAETLPMKLSFPAGGRRNGVLKLRVTSRRRSRCNTGNRRSSSASTASSDMALSRDSRWCRGRCPRESEPHRRHAGH